jgi:DNA polymerase-1
VHCTWHQTATATGRISSSAPNLQAVTKYTLQAAGAEGQLVNIRDAFVAPPGCVLLAADYSQVGAYHIQ